MIAEARKGEPPIVDLPPNVKRHGCEVDDTCLAILKRGEKVHEPGLTRTQRTSISKEGTMGQSCQNLFPAMEIWALRGVCLN